MVCVRVYYVCVVICVYGIAYYVFTVYVYRLYKLVCGCGTWNGLCMWGSMHVMYASMCVYV